MRRLYIIVPIFPSDAFMSEKLDRWESWHLQNRGLLKRIFKIRHLEELVLWPNSTWLLAGDVTIKYSSPDPPIPMSVERAPGVPKGLAVRLALAAILDEVDAEDGGNGVLDRQDTFIIQIDGSGAFDYNNIYRIAEALIRGGEDVVLGRRSGDWFMTHKDRKTVEMFENALLETWKVRTHGKGFDEPLLDAQAGCWGLRASVLRKISLTAPRYELEFDLIASAVMGNISFCFSSELKPGIRIGPSGMQSTTDPAGYAGAVRKMPFIAHKLEMSKPDIGQALDAYISRSQENSVPALPTGYVELLRTWIAT